MSFFRRLVSKPQSPVPSPEGELADTADSAAGRPELKPDQNQAGDGSDEPSSALEDPTAGHFTSVKLQQGSPLLDDDWNEAGPGAPKSGEPAFQDDLNDQDGASSSEGPAETVAATPGPPEMDGAILVVSAADGPMPNGEDDLPHDLSGIEHTDAVAATGAIISADFNYVEHTTLVRLDPTDLKDGQSLLVGFHSAEPLDSEETAISQGEDSDSEDLPDL
jgi:hypothetical protein